MFNRFLFFLNIAVIGAVSGIGMWWMYRSGFVCLQPTWTVIFFLVLPLSFALPHVAIDHMPIFFTKICAWIGGYWFIFVLYSTMLMIVYFLTYLALTLFQYQELWLIVSGRIAFGGCMIILLGITAGTWNALHPVYQKIDILTNKPLRRDITIAFVTDIHLSPIFSNWHSRRLAKKLNTVNPDAVIFGGDIIDGNLDFVLADNSYTQFQKIHAPLGIYAVYGNHDYFNGNLEKEASQFTPLHFLRNRSVILDDSIQLTGLDDYLHDPAAPILRQDTGYFKILVDHEPLRIKPASLAGYDLYLAGHTHAGQFFPITWITNRMYLLNYGAKKFKDMLAVVSSGYGFWGTPVRLGPPPEIVLLHLKKTTIMSTIE